MEIFKIIGIVLIVALQIVNIVLTSINVHWWKIYADDLQDDYEMWEDCTDA